MPQISGASSLLRCSPMAGVPWMENGSAARRLEAPDLKRPPGPRDEIPVNQPGYENDPTEVAPEELRTRLIFPLA